MIAWRRCSVRILVFVCLCIAPSLCAQTRKAFHIVVLAEPGGLHGPFVKAARLWLEEEAKRDHFSIEQIENTNRIDEAFLRRCDVFIQLNYPPYNWTQTAKQAFQRYIDEGWGGWIGFHHASLLGEFDGFSMWPWFSDFMGGIRWKDYIASFSSAVVRVEDPEHPVLRGLPTSFTIKDEEWYTWSKSPRASVQVLASVDESSYMPNSPIKMGDHPVIWSNWNKKARNVYIFMGHHPELLQDKNFVLLFHNAILWAAGRTR